MTSFAAQPIGVSFAPVVISRRAALAGLIVAAAGVSTAVLVAHPLGDAPLSGSGSAAGLAAARADALSAVGARNSGSAWQLAAAGTVGSAWAATLASWIVRDAQVPQTADPQALYDWFAASGALGDTARDGALVFYQDVNGAVVHVGFVDEVFGEAIMTIEGDVPGGLDHDQTFVRRFGRPWSESVRYGYPPYAD